MDEPTIGRRTLMQTGVAAALGASVAGIASGDVEESDTPGAPSVKGSLKRFSTTATGAEMTGPFVFPDGTLLHSLQHPARDNPDPYDKSGIGYYKAFSFELDGSNDDFAEAATPQTEATQDVVNAAAGEFELLAQEEDPINGGDELLGVPQTPDGRNTFAESFPATRYGNAAYNPDCNEFIPTNDEGTEGYLFTNWENSPGNISRIPVAKTEDGWRADLENAINLANTEALRELGGTRINCYGDRSPWNTMLSSEENYAHVRTSLKATISDIEEAGTGKGLVGGCEFWNRPNPSKIQDAVDSYYGDDSWYVQGYWAMTGVEMLAYYLGAEVVDEAADGSNTTTPIGDVYPNPYRYGYHVDIREPAAEEPTPVKYYVMGRASWEAPNVQADERTVYECSDGDSKGIYKFVADEPIPSYDDPMEVAGTLYAPKITNDAAAADPRKSPADATLEIEWLELGHASNAEVAAWIAEYDDVTQVDYLETHADTDWQADLDAALEEADREVVANGNRNYVTHEEILAWAEQYEARGPDGVDEDLRKVPFLETREAAKEIGASIEFNKAEGVDSREGAGPGEFVYFGISELNDALADDEGDIQLDRVDGGVVYRGQLEADYNVSTLEPVIVGPDFTDPPEDADDALRNIDNVYVLDDGRVLCCEDGFGGPARSYPNDGLYVYQPNVILDVDSVAVESGGTGTVTLSASALPQGLSGATVTVEVADRSVAAIEDVTFADALGFTQASVEPNGTAATLRFADGDQNVEPGAMNVDIADLELKARGVGTTEITVTVEQMDDDSGTPIDAETNPGMLVTGPGPIDGGRPPTDPDDDGRYEDVNGNGRLDYRDIVVLFENFDGESVRLNESNFDFNENGRLDYDDVMSLYEDVA